MKLTDKETATVLAALRHWQDHTPQEFKKDWLHMSDHPPLTLEEIDDLCERINCVESPGLADPPDFHRFEVQVSGCTYEQANTVLRERLGHDEDYGFPYQLNW